MEIERIATRTIGDAFGRIEELARKGKGQCGPLYSESGDTLTYEEGEDIVSECSLALEYAKEHLQYLRPEKEEGEDVQPPEDKFRPGESVIVMVGVSGDDDQEEPATVIKVEHYADGATGVLVRFDRSDQTGTFDIQDVRPVAV